MKDKVLDQLLKKPEAQERLAELEEAVVTLQETLAMWRQSGFPQKTLIVLLAHSTKVSQRVIREVLDGLDSLCEDYFELEDDE